MPRRMDALTEIIAGLLATVVPIEEELARALDEVAGALPAAERETWLAEARAALTERRAALERHAAPILALVHGRLGLATRAEIAELRARIERLEGRS